MDKQPLFSIIVASYNNGKYLPECLESLINQTYKNIEIVVVDDASTDNSKEIIFNYSNRYKNIKPIIKPQNKGVGHTKYLGALNSTGNLLGTIGADDKLENNAIELMVNAHSENPEAGLIYSSLYFCNYKLEIQSLNENIKAIPNGETYLTWKLSNSGTISGFRTMKREIYVKTAGFSPYFKKAVDKDIIFKMEEASKTYFLNIPLYYYRLHENNISRNKNAWQAFLWEVKAKEAAYYRRLDTNIPNISKDQLMNDYYFAFKNLAAEALIDKNYFRFINYVWLVAEKFRNPIKCIKFAYYIIKKHLKPERFNS